MDSARACGCAVNGCLGRALRTKDMVLYGAVVNFCQQRLCPARVGSDE